MHAGYQEPLAALGRQQFNRIGYAGGGAGQETLSVALIPAAAWSTGVVRVQNT